MVNFSKSAYNLIKSGITDHQGEILRFLNLEFIPKMKRDQQASFRVLKERIRRLTLKILLDSGYITKLQLKIQIKNKYLNDKMFNNY